MLNYRQIAHDIWFVELETPRKTAYTGMIRKITDYTYIYVFEGRMLDNAQTLKGIKKLIETRYSSNDS